MEIRDGSTPREDAAREQLLSAGAALTGAPHERRHDSLMEWAESELSLEREYAEQVYTLGEEGHVEPVYAFHRVLAGIEVREMITPEQDMEKSVQQAPPEWVAED